MLFVLFVCFGFIWNMKNWIIVKGMFFVLIGFFIWVIFINNKFDYFKIFVYSEIVVMFVVLFIVVLLLFLWGKFNVKG